MKKNTKRYTLIFGLLVVLLLASCSTVDKAKDKLGMGKTSEPVIANNTAPVPAEKTYSLPNAEKIVYTFEEQQQRFIEYTSYTKEYLYCLLPMIEDQEVAKQLVSLHTQKVDVKIILDNQATFITCDPTCIPNKKSQFNYLLENDIAMKKNDLKSAYCINEHGVFFTTSNFADDADYITHSILLYNNQLSQGYKQHFEELW